MKKILSVSIGLSLLSLIAPFSFAEAAASYMRSPGTQIRKLNHSASHWSRWQRRQQNLKTLDQYATEDEESFEEQKKERTEDKLEEYTEGMTEGQKAAMKKIWVQKQLEKKRSSKRTSTPSGYVRTQYGLQKETYQDRQKNHMRSGGYTPQDRREQLKAIYSGKEYRKAYINRRIREDE